MALSRFIRRSINSGWRACVFSHWRFDWSDPRDLSTVVDHLHASNPDAQIFACAWSAGAHLLLSYLGHSGPNTGLVAAAVQSPCLDVADSYCQLLENENPSYLKYIQNQTINAAYRHLKHDTTLTEVQRQRLDDLIHSKTLRIDQLYEEIQQMLASFRGEEYSPLDLKTLMADIDVSTLLIHADDDPIVTTQKPGDWDRLVSANKNLLVLTTHYGGHVGWYEGWFPFSSWGDRIIVSWFSAVCEALSLQITIEDLMHRAMNQNQEGSRNRLRRYGSAASFFHQLKSEI